MLVLAVGKHRSRSLNFGLGGFVIFYFLDTCSPVVPDVISVFSVSRISHLFSVQVCK